MTMHSWNRLCSSSAFCSYVFKGSLRKKRQCRKGIKAERWLCGLLFLTSSQSSSSLWASFQDISDPTPIVICVVEIRKMHETNSPSAVSCFPFFSVTIPSGFGDFSSKIDFNSLGIKHLVLTLPSSCQSQSELNVMSEDFNIIPSKWLDGVLCYLNLC